ncbi:type IV pilin [Halosimplex salinum]|uniref:type IV pilin n=1 Tax=Halosimplex salinum TaxID=1710538 RepID=UPI000F4AB019|nr:type IV pilin [Halosimplex salinum]
MTERRPHGSPPTGRQRRRSNRATSPVVGCVVLVGLTVLLASVAVAAVGIDGARPESTPQAHLSAELSATDGWPDGQRLRLVHEAGDTLAVADLAVVVEVERTGEATRAREFPTRRLTDDHVRGADLFDRTYAGVDGELDAAHTDGRWESGEAASVRIAQRAVDLRSGDRATVRVIHRSSNGQIAQIEVQAS